MAVRGKILYKTTEVGKRLLKNLFYATSDVILAGLVTKKTLKDFQEIGIFNNRVLKFSKEELTNIMSYYNKHTSTINNRLINSLGLSCIGILTRLNDAIRIKLRMGIHSNSLDIKKKANLFKKVLEEATLPRYQKLLEEHLNSAEGDPRIFLVVKKSTGSINRVGNYDNRSALAQVSEVSFDFQFGITLASDTPPDQSIIGLHSLLGLSEFKTYSLGNSLISEQLFKPIGKLFAKGGKEPKSFLENLNEFFSSICDSLEKLTEVTKVKTDQKDYSKIIKSLLDPNTQTKNIRKFLNDLSTELIATIRSASFSSGSTAGKSRTTGYTGNTFRNIDSVDHGLFKLDIYKSQNNGGFDLRIKNIRSPDIPGVSILFVFKKLKASGQTELRVTVNVIQTEDNKEKLLYSTKPFNILLDSLNDEKSIAILLKKGEIKNTGVEDCLSAIKTWI